MKRIAQASVAVAVSTVALLAIQPALAHHSFAMFDRTKDVKIQGTVKVFQWTNPHSWLQVVTGEPGRPGKEYSIEMGSPNTLSRGGWRRTSFKPGDRVTVIIHPMRDGSAGGALVSAVDAQGKPLGTQ